uniref:Uncharacterized protein n=1 Tax=Ditylenchus dipsaci TaxID=166011 RepID=A0A915DCL1_9BILA
MVMLANLWTLLLAKARRLSARKNLRYFFPPRTYAKVDTEADKGAAGPAQPDGLATIGRAVEQFLSGPPAPAPEYGQLPPGFGQGFSLKNGKTPLASFQQNADSVSTNVEDKAEGPRYSPGKSSISGIPNDYPKLPKFPMSNFNEQVRRQQTPVVMQNVPEVPKFMSKPEVPEGGLGPAAEVRRHPASVSEAVLSSSAADASEYGTLTDETHVPGGLIGTVLDLFGMNKEGKPSDANELAKQ